MIIGLWLWRVRFLRQHTPGGGSQRVSGTHGVGVRLPFPVPPSAATRPPLFPPSLSTVRSCTKFDCGCVCDVLPGACDANCCCDVECPAAVVQAVVAAGNCLPAGPAPSTVQYCVDVDQFVGVNPRKGCV